MTDEPEPSLRIVVSGSGKMGREVLAAVYREQGLTPVGVLEKFAAEDRIHLPDGESIPMSNDAAALIDLLRPDVIIDFTNAEWTCAFAPMAVESGVRLVIGTTGLPAGWVDEMDHRCRERKIGAVVSSNFALGAVLMMHVARVVAPFFDHAEIIELHHDEKVDAPSGTALQTVRGMLEARGRPFVHPPTERQTLAGTRGGVEDGATIHSVRLPGLVAHQEVIFGGLGQTLTIRHDTTGRECYMPGIVMAARAVMQKVGVVRGLEELMGLR
ncbi:MAG TPA: 4-hydroxy-tetrahydrodipicolinate reductase [Dehalococcoidia bacterium]|nr:4-hydroxy-tetrahydrodipicolinate reductase [Dehalococcoidia bacterium]